MKNGNLYRRELIKHIRWYIKIRWFYLTAIVLSGVLSQLFVIGWDLVIIKDILLLAIGIMANLLFYRLARQKQKSFYYYYFLALAQVLFDIGVATYAVYDHGGTEARTLILYAVPLFAAGTLFGRRALIFAIIASIIAYDAIIFMEIEGLIKFNAVAQALYSRENPILPVIFYNTMFIILAVIGKRSFDVRSAGLLRQQRQLIRLNTAKDEFISLASHQLRTPASGVKQYLGMILEGYMGDIPPNQASILQKAYDTNERQINIVNEILSVTQLETGSFVLKQELHDVSKLLATCINEHKNRIAEKGQTIRFTKPKRKLYANIDYSRMIMVFDNLLDNASRYSPNGTRITVIAKHLPDNKIEIRVHDLGDGIQKEEVHHLFRKFSRLENPITLATEGSGLGLYICKKILELHDGSIRLDTSKPRGATFVVTIPAVKKGIVRFAQMTQQSNS